MRKEVKGTNPVILIIQGAVMKGGKVNGAQKGLVRDWTHQAFKAGSLLRSLV
jgi:hypothetical protein